MVLFSLLLLLLLRVLEAFRCGIENIVSAIVYLGSRNDQPSLLRTVMNGLHLNSYDQPSLLRTPTSYNKLYKRLGHPRVIPVVI